MTKAKMVCPTHQTKLESKGTRFGKRWGCPEEGCTVACWEGSTSTPADDETRELRIRCHAVFDGLYERQRSQTGKRFSSRANAYNWLARALDLKPKETHIGMFDKAMCLKLLEVLKEVPA